MKPVEPALQISPQALWQAFRRKLRGQASVWHSEATGLIKGWKRNKIKVAWDNIAAGDICRLFHQWSELNHFKSAIPINLKCSKIDLFVIDLVPSLLPTQKTKNLPLILNELTPTSKGKTPTISSFSPPLNSSSLAKINFSISCRRKQAKKQAPLDFAPRPIFTAELGHWVW